MPCFSNITGTSIFDLQILLSSLSQLQFAVEKNSTELKLVTSIGTFSRQKATDAFLFSGNKSLLSQVGRKYSENSIRDWAIKNRMSVISQNGQEIVLQDRQTGGKLVAEIQNDGGVKLNATKLIGTEKELVKSLESLATALGGKLTIEKHVHSHRHAHSHSHAHTHSHGHGHGHNH